jgi:hypothetical protein
MIGDVTALSITQYATPSLIADIAYRGHPAGDDPNWAVSGAPDVASYSFWCSRICGIACLKMALAARDGTAPSLFELLTECIDYGGYVRRADGSVGGLYYEPFTRLLRERHNMVSEVIADMPSARIIEELGAGRFVMASVHKEVRRPEFPSPGRGGHLVLVTHYQDGRFHFLNPSGHTPAAVNATLAADVFDSFAAHRGIALHV